MEKNDEPPIADNNSKIPPVNYIDSKYEEEEYPEEPIFIKPEDIEKVEKSFGKLISIPIEENYDPNTTSFIVKKLRKICSFIDFYKDLASEMIQNYDIFLYILDLFLATTEDEILCEILNFLFSISYYGNPEEHFINENFLLKLESCIESTNKTKADYSIKIVRNCCCSSSLSKKIPYSILSCIIKTDMNEDDRLFFCSQILNYEVDIDECIICLDNVTEIFLEHQDHPDIQKQAMKAIEKLINQTTEENWPKIERFFTEEVIKPIVNAMFNEKTSIACANILSKLAVHYISQDLIFDLVETRLDITLSAIMATSERRASLIFYWNCLRYGNYVPRADIVHKIYDFLDFGTVEEKIIALSYVYLLVFQIPTFNRENYTSEQEVETLSHEVFGEHLIESTLDIVEGLNVDSESLGIICQGLSYLIYNNDNFLKCILEEDVFYEQFTELCTNEKIIKNPLAYESFLDISSHITELRKEAEEN